MQKRPLLDGAGESHRRFLVRIPPPQEREHIVHSVHPPQFPSAEMKCIVVITDASNLRYSEPLLVNNMSLLLIGVTIGS